MNVYIPSEVIVSVSTTLLLTTNLNKSPVAAETVTPKFPVYPEWSPLATCPLPTGNPLTDVIINQAGVTSSIDAPNPPLLVILINPPPGAAVVVVVVGAPPPEVVVVVVGGCVVVVVVVVVVGGCVVVVVVVGGCVVVVVVEVVDDVTPAHTVWLANIPTLAPVFQ